MDFHYLTETLFLQFFLRLVVHHFLAIRSFAGFCGCNSSRVFSQVAYLIRVRCMGFAPRCSPFLPFERLIRLSNYPYSSRMSTEITLRVFNSSKSLRIMDCDNCPNIVCQYLVLAGVLLQHHSQTIPSPKKRREKIETSAHSSSSRMFTNARKDKNPPAPGCKRSPY